MELRSRKLLKGRTSMMLEAEHVLEKRQKTSKGQTTDVANDGEVDDVRCVLHGET